jgi:hypothetical protein
MSSRPFSEAAEEGAGAAAALSLFPLESDELPQANASKAPAKRTNNFFMSIV